MQPKERKITRAISQANTENQRIRDILEKDFALSYISRNDIIKYKLYEELEANGFKTLYSGTYIPKEKTILQRLRCRAYHSESTLV